jgi:XTP/dITP diphosphohydrolase
MKINEIEFIHGRAELLIASHNPGKIGEFHALLSDLPFRLTDLRHFPDIPEIDETGGTFEENARIKAIGYAKASGMYSMADDSGLEVKALRGAPGVRSARFAGAQTGYDVKISKLLDEIAASKDVDRSACFVSHIVLADPEGNVMYKANGVCEGTIAEGPRGSNGFGYDPIFIPDGFTKTFGELDPDVKKTLSHRARALAKIIRFLRDFA